MRNILQINAPINCNHLLGDDNELFFAIILQNIMHPKNAKRREAIVSGEYVELKTITDAKKYLSHLLEQNLSNQLLGIESECRSVLVKLAQGQGVQLVIEAESVYVAAAVMIQKKFSNGAGDRKSIIDEILSSDPYTIPDLARKLQLVISYKFHGKDLFSDNFGQFAPQEIGLRKKLVFRLWLHLCKRHNAVTAQQLADLFPMHEARIMIWDKYANEDG